MPLRPLPKLPSKLGDASAGGEEGGGREEVAGAGMAIAGATGGRSKRLLGYHKGFVSSHMGKLFTDNILVLLSCDARNPAGDASHPWVNIPLCASDVSIPLDYAP